MYIEDFESIVGKIKDRKEEADDYLDQLPIDLSTYMFDNQYVNNIGMINDILFDAYFGELNDHVFWFLYEWTPGKEIHDSAGVSYSINSFSDFVEATKQIYNLPMKPKNEDKEFN